MARPARPWFRFYVEAVHDRKLRRLKPEHRWLFVVCLAVARQSPVPGVLLVGDSDPMGLDDLVDVAAMPRAQVRAGMDALQGAGVVTLNEDFVWTIPAWADRQYESDNSAERVRKHRLEQPSNAGCNGQTPLLVTPPETETDTESERESKHASAKPPPPPIAMAPKAKKGSRIPDQFDVTEDMVTWVEANAPGVNWDRETLKFVNYWKSVPGQRGVKLDWTATWRSWMLKAADYPVAR